MEKDLKRQTKNPYLKEVQLQIEDIYSWIEVAFKQILKQPEAIINCFAKAGYVKPIPIQQQLSNMEEEQIEIPVNSDDVFEIEEEQQLEQQDDSNKEDIFDNDIINNDAIEIEYEM